MGRPAIISVVVTLLVAALTVGGYAGAYRALGWPDGDRRVFANERQAKFFVLGARFESFCTGRKIQTSFVSARGENWTDQTIVGP